MLIKLLHGTYGAREDGIIVTKTNKSAPFHVEEKRGRELIASGYARKVDDTNPADDNEQEVIGEKQDEETVKNDNVDNYSIQDLRKLASKMGLSAGGSKKELLERIKANSKSEGNLPDEESAQENESGNSEEPLLLKAVEPEV